MTQEVITDEILEVLQNRIYAIDSLQFMTENLELLELSQIQDWWEYWNQRHIGKARMVAQAEKWHNQESAE